MQLVWSWPKTIQLEKNNNNSGGVLNYTMRQVILEATTSWSYVGAGLRLSMELLGPEYSMSLNSLDSGPKLFFSRRVKGEAGEDLVEKQNAEQGLMPVVVSEAGEYGYEGENRHFVECFADGQQPEENFYEISAKDSAPLGNS